MGSMAFCYWQISYVLIINRGVSHKSAEVISKLYRSYVKPPLENCTVLDIMKCERCRYARWGTEKSI